MQRPEAGRFKGMYFRTEFLEEVVDEENRKASWVVC